MNRAQLITCLEDVIDMVKDSNEKGIEPVYFIPPCDEIPDEEKAENEYDKLGFFVSFHPLDNFRIKLSSLPTIQQLEERMSGEAVMLAGLLMDTQERTTKSGNKMGIFTLEDLTGRVEVVVFGRAFDQFKPFLNLKNPAVQIGGKLDIQERELEDGEVIKTPKIILNKISRLEEASKISSINISLTKQDVPKLGAIHKLLTNNPGDIKINLEFRSVKFEIPLTLLQDQGVLRELGALCHYETLIAKGKA